MGDAVGNETCVYCVPSKPIDAQREVSYHEDVLKTIIEQYGYNVKVIEEAVALDMRDWLIINYRCNLYGCGMCNIAVMYQGMTALSFSVGRGGDWIDECVSQDTGVSKAKVLI